MHRPTRFISMVALTAVMTMLLGVGAVAAAHTTLTVSLSGSAEVPQPGDPNGKGSGTVSLYPSTDNPTGNNVCYELKLQAIGTPVAAHIHEAPVGVAGGVVVNLDIGNAERHGNRLSNCVTVDQEIVNEILADPSEYYVNVHTAEFPGGAVRGQLGS
ncbi:MAG: CHRD domain-containing protein [Chloroflexi bacterium]|nr:CHRD domain-containing protein [Chloroflexota bacterium]